MSLFNSMTLKCKKIKGYSKYLTSSKEWLIFSKLVEVRVSGCPWFCWEIMIPPPQRKGSIQTDFWHLFLQWKIVLSEGKWLVWDILFQSREDTEQTPEVMHVLTESATSPGTGEGETYSWGWGSLSDPWGPKREKKNQVQVANYRSICILSGQLFGGLKKIT